MIVLGLQRERGERTILQFLTERMDGVAPAERRKSLKERLGLNGIGCCGAHLGFGPINVLDDEESSPLDPIVPNLAQAESNRQSPVAAVVGMNLATALAAERQYRAAQDWEGEVSPEISRPNSSHIGEAAPGTPSRMSLMRLLHETDGEDLEKGNGEKVVAGVGSDAVCCVCMGRKKGAAFIPCGHTFCRVCSRELWLNRGSCPLCNRPIIEILDIF